MTRHEMIRHVVLVTYDNDRTYARYFVEPDAAQQEVTTLLAEPDVTNAIVEPYVGRTYFPGES